MVLDIFKSIHYLFFTLLSMPYLYNAHLRAIPILDSKRKDEYNDFI